MALKASASSENIKRPRTEELEILNSDDDERKPRFVYSYEGGTVELHLASLECLESDSSYLKDNIVQFYSAYLLHSICDKTVRSRVRIFDSIFYELMVKTFTLEKVDRNGFKQIRKWYEGDDLFKEDFIIFPICSSGHWFAIIACYPRHVADFPPGGPRTDVEDKTPGLMVLDSLGLKAAGHTGRIMDLFDFEWRTKCLSVKRFSHTDMKVYCPKLPRQTNTYDCGLYMLSYFECFLQNPDRFYQAAKENTKDKELRSQIEGILKNNSRSQLRSIIRKVCKNI